MKIKDIQLVGATICFTEGILDLEAYPEPGMHATIKSVGPPDSEGVVCIIVDYSQFDEVNKTFETANYWDGKGNACLDAREAGFYEKVEKLYFMADDEIGKSFNIVEGAIVLPKNFTIHDGVKAIRYLQQLLGVTELNIDDVETAYDLEHDTRVLVQEISEWVTKFE